MLNWSLLLLRVGIGGMLLGVHGWGRLMKAIHLVFQGQAWTFVGLVQRMGFPMPTFFAVASALAESVGAILLIAGLWTRWAALAIAINMAVAVGLEISKHSPDWEKPALYLLPAVVVMIAGPGSRALDAWRGRKGGRVWAAKAR